MSASSLFSSELYERGVLNPAGRGANRLLVVSGYATPSMASQALTDVNEHSQASVEVDLVVGMTGLEGISVEAHRGFESLHVNPPAGRLRVKYMPRGRVVNSKLYVWMRDDDPICAFAGSSNFTHNGFLLGRRNRGRSELLVSVEPDEALAEFNRIESESISIDHPDLLDEVTVRRKVDAPEWTESILEDSVAFNQTMGLATVVLPLVMTGGPKATRGEVHPRSGLNWGQRPEYRREPNQAYIPVPAQIARTGFFPPRGVQFLVNTDDNKAIMMVVAEDGDKALHSPQGNQLIGEYFRMRVGVANGAPVHRRDLDRFGSRFVRFYRVDDESYFMEYSPTVEADGASFYGV